MLAVLESFVTARTGLILMVCYKCQMTQTTIMASIYRQLHDCFEIRDACNKTRYVFTNVQEPFVVESESTLVDEIQFIWATKPFVTHIPSIQPLLTDSLGFSVGPSMDVQFDSFVSAFCNNDTACITNVCCGPSIVHAGWANLNLLVHFQQ